MARIGTPQAAGACLPSLKTRFPLTKVSKTFPANLLPIYADRLCIPNLKTRFHKINKSLAKNIFLGNNRNGGPFWNGEKYNFYKSERVFFRTKILNSILDIALYRPSLRYYQYQYISKWSLELQNVNHVYIHLSLIEYISDITHLVSNASPTLPT